MSILIDELMAEYGDELIDELISSVGKAVKDDTLDKFSDRQKNENKQIAQKYFFNLDKATDKILNPYADKGGLYVKKNRFAGSMKQLKSELYKNNMFMKDYNLLIYNNSKDKPSMILSHDEIYNIFKNEKQKNELRNLINEHSNYKLTDRDNNIKKENNNNNIMDGIKETPINPNNDPNKPIPTTLNQSDNPQLWAPRVMLGGQNVLKLSDVEKISEMKNYTMFDLVTEINTDIDNLLHVQNEIKNKIRFYNTYDIPNIKEKSSEINDNIILNQRPMMNSLPVKYPFRLDNTGNQQSNKYYSTWADQEKTELVNDYDVIKRSNLDPDVIQLVNKDKINDNTYQNISDIDMYMFNR
jgi:hypothetical protein